MTPTIVFGIILAFIRILIGIYKPKQGLWLNIYKDTAHMYIAALATCWWFQTYDWQWWLFWGLNTVEVVTAILSRITKKT